MKVVSIHEYIYLGTNIWYFQTMNTRRTIDNPGGIKENLRSLTSKLDSFGFPVSTRAARKLVKYCNEQFELAEGNRFSSAVCEEVSKIANILRPTINAEAQGLFAHILTEQRYSSEYLLDDPWKLFAPDARSKLDDIAVNDIEEAAKCIVFERPTAAAFHLMRATESILKHFYCHLVRRNRVALMWGPMITALKAKRNPPDAALLDHLDSLRRNFRNPTQHPEKIYDITEVQDLFGVCVDVINRMASDMPSRT